MQKTFLARQGDVLIRQVAAPKKAPKAYVNPKEAKGRSVLAYGEATGHKHAIRSLDVTAYTSETAESFVKEIDTRGAVTPIDLIEVGGSGASLRHEYDSGAPAEHDPIELKPGWYQIGAQVEYKPGELRVVSD